MKFETNINRRFSARHKKCLNFWDYKNKRILDIGCSYGWFEKFKGKEAKEIYALDPCKEDLERAKKEVNNKKIKFVGGSALNFENIKKNYFDVAVMFDVIEHIPKNKELIALKNINSVMKKGGKLVISTPADNFSKFFDPAWYFGHRHYTIAKLKNLLEKAGFKINKTEICGSFFELFSMILFYPAKWLFNSEIPFKDWFDRKRNDEYLNKKRGIVTLFIAAEKI
jgi:SAM-dependent methyltransferase